MKIVYINISDIQGGASIVANRLRIFLEKHYQTESLYLVADKNLHDDNVYAVRRNFGEIFEKIIDRISNFLGMQYQFFPFSSRFMLEKIKKYNPDVINIHNTHGGYFETRLLQKLSRIAPIVWTLHDMWSFTGNAAHTFGNESWKEMKNDYQLTKIHPKIGLNTGAFLLKQKARVYRESDLSITVPCQWLFHLTSQSSVFHGKKITQIYNGLDLSTFSPKSKISARQKLGIPASAKVIMFSAAALTGNMWKGGDHLVEILRQINSSISYKVHLLVVGSGELNILPKLTNLIIHQVGYVSSEVEMANCLSASDIFIYPTKADTLPNILVEAIACGVPCITFDIGGCSEIVINNINGKIIAPFQIATMSETIIRLLEDDRERELMSENARNHAEKYFSIELMAENYYKFFCLSAHRFKTSSHF